MCNVFFISDLHLGHEGALKWARDYREGETIDEMNEWLITQWNSVVGNRDLVWVLGDVSFKLEDLPLLDRMNGRKKLTLGNHDTFPLSEYEKYFEWVGAYKKYKGFWLSHMPLHSYDMDHCRVRGNIHGHLHQNFLDDYRYYNVCIEHCDGVPINFQSILEYHNACKEVLKCS